MEWEPLEAYKLFVKGIVQGVGFRPFVYNLATSLQLKGYVLNTSGGVEIVIEGKRCQEFLNRFQTELPPLAKVVCVAIEKRDKQNYQKFVIKKSKEGPKEVFLSPDMSICNDCLQDLFNPKNRRYLYPFINCTNCGPRYTIIKDLPYDRKNTTMAKFAMCKKCKKEYKDPKSRFYHAQPISCATCGPTLYCNEYKNQDAIKEAVKLLQQNKILAIKGVGGFHFVCKAYGVVVDELRKRKKRSKKPFAVMFKDISSIEKACIIDEEEKRLIQSKERPIVVVKKREAFNEAAPDIDRLGVFLPYNPIYSLLFASIDFPLIVTSANISDEPIIKDEERIEELNITDGIVWYDREIERSCDDSVAVVVDKKALFYRLSRGFAPQSFFIDEKLEPILAVGARQKNTIALGFEHSIILSPHIGDIKNIQSYEYFQKVVSDFLNMYDVNTKVVVCDKHPTYETTQFAKSLGIEVIEVQHHLAHVYAAKAEMYLTNHPLKNQEFVSFSWDGTGFGDDGKIWGGEVFVADERKYHFDYFKIAGGEKAIKDIKLIAWSLMKKAGMHVHNALFNLAYEKNINCFETSSVGRLFDAVAFLSGICEYAEYEGYSGLLIEKAYRGGEERYEFAIENGKIIIDFYSLLEDSKEYIPTKFLNTLAAIIVDIAKKEQMPVLLTGGVFQNKTLLQQAIKKLQQAKIPYFFQSKTPINDGGISLGQLWWAKSHRF